MEGRINTLYFNYVVVIENNVVSIVQCTARAAAVDTRHFRLSILD